RQALQLLVQSSAIGDEYTAPGDLVDALGELLFSIQVADAEILHLRQRSGGGPRCAQGTKNGVSATLHGASDRFRGSCAGAPRGARADGPRRSIDGRPAPLAICEAGRASACR